MPRCLLASKLFQHYLSFQSSKAKTIYFWTTFFLFLHIWCVCAVWHRITKRNVKSRQRESVMASINLVVFFSSLCCLLNPKQREAKRYNSWKRTWQSCERSSVGICSYLLGIINPYTSLVDFSRGTFWIVVSPTALKEASLSFNVHVPQVL